MASAAGGAKKHREIYTYSASWPIYALAASNHPSPELDFRFAIGSFVEEYCNKVQIVQLDDERGEFVGRGSFDHPYPATKLVWAPASVAKDRDLLLTVGDYLRVWAVNGEDTKMEAVLNNVRVCVGGGGRGGAQPGAGGAGGSHPQPPPRRTKIQSTAPR